MPIANVLIPLPYIIYKLLIGYGIWSTNFTGNAYLLMTQPIWEWNKI